MLFESTIGASSVAPTDWNSIQESKYDLGIEGAYMHMYENQCNFNAIMKSVGLSELAYYRDNGQSLFVNEAGAVTGFISKAKDFFKKVLEKIKGIIKKFIMLIQSHTSDNKKFVKKYEKDLLRVDTTDFEFNGYNFNKSSIKDTANVAEFIKVDAAMATRTTGINNIDYSFNNDALEYGNAADATRYNNTSDKIFNTSKNYADSDAINDEIEKQRALLINKTNSSFTEDELREEFHNMLYGEDGKTTLECGKDFTIRECLEWIRNNDKAIKTVEKFDRTNTQAFDKLDKALNNAQVKLTKVKGDNATKNSAMDVAMANLNAEITICKAVSNSITMLCGMMCTALKDRCAQSKAICVKAISYKHESAMVGGYADDSLFGNVVLR